MDSNIDITSEVIILDSNIDITSEDHTKMQWYQGYRKEYYDDLYLLINDIENMVYDRYIINKSLYEYSEHQNTKEWLLQSCKMIKNWCKEEREY